MGWAWWLGGGQVGRLAGTLLMRFTLAILAGFLVKRDLVVWSGSWRCTPRGCVLWFGRRGILEEGQEVLKYDGAR